MRNTIYRVVSLFVGFFACAVVLSGCFAPAEASPGDTSLTITPTNTATLMPTLPAGPAVVPTQIPATSGPLVIAQGVTEPQMTQTVFQATQFAIGTQLILGITTTYEANLTLTATFAGTPQPAQPQDNGNPTLTPTTAPVGATIAPQGVAGQPGSGAAGIIGPDCVYTVVEGDRLFRIALRFGLATDVVVQANGIVNPDLIHPNDRYLIPNCNATPIPATLRANIAGGGTAYTVVGGDTLFSLAARNNTTVQAIAQANNIANVNLIIVGQQLVIP